MIPKKIHYCWYGGNPYNEMIKKCIASWKKHLPDYTIVKWDETNTPFEQITVLKTLYRNKKWAFISDYMRAYSVYQEGGIYLDTDVELIKPFGALIHHKAFLGFQYEFHISKYPLTNAVYGAVAKHPFSLAILKETEKKQRLSFHQVGGPFVVSPYLLNKGVKTHENQEVEGVHLLTKDYFFPYYHRTESFSKECLTENTIGIHWWADSWSEKNKTLAYKLKSAHSKLRRLPSMIFDGFKFLLLPSKFYDFD